MSITKSTYHVAQSWLENDRLGDLFALVLAIGLVIAVATLLPL